MSKRSRRERRAGQAQRAVEAQDTGAFDALVATNPETAAQHLGRALSAVPADRSSPLDGVAEDLCSRLRTSGKLEAAYKLASGTAHRSKRLRLESALAAFALGLDGEAERAASGDADVAAVIAPLLGAARPPSDPPAAKAGDRARARRLDGKPAALRALHDAAAAATSTLAGDVTAARAALRRVPKALEATLLVNAMSAAIDLSKPSSPGFRASIDRLLRSPAVKESARAKEALVLTLALHDTVAAVSAAEALHVADAVARPLQIRAALAAAPLGAWTASAALELAGKAGADVFDPPHRANACLHEGFALLDADPKRAARALDRAVELGGDLLEALRGKLLLASSSMGARCPDCGGYHDDEDKKGREVGAAADRFARAARRLPAGAPFAVVASIIAAEGWDADDNTKAALASLEAARAAAGETMRDELDLREAQIVAYEQPKRSAALLDDLLARDPTSVPAWRTKIELARGHEQQLADDLVVQAAAATKDPELEGLARRVRAARGEVAPFDGLAPGTVTAGALAAEAEDWLGGPEPSPALPDVAMACRAALAPDARLAFDVALLFIEVAAGKRDEATRRLADTLAAWWSSPPSLARLAASLWLIDLEDALVAAARPLANAAGAGAALGALTDAAIAADDDAVAQTLLGLGAGHWSRAEIKERRAALSRLRRREAGGAGARAAPDPVFAGRAIDALLAPEFRLPFEEDDAEEGEPEEDAREFLDQAIEALAVLGVSEREVMTAGPAKLTKLLEVLSDMARGKPTTEKLLEMKKVVRRILGAP